MSRTRHLDEVSLLPQPTRERFVAAHETDRDHDVVELARGGDVTGALRRLMQRHGTAIYRYCRVALNDAALAEDVQQQVFLHAFQGLPKFGGRSKLRTWLFGIARHRVLDAVKARRHTAAAVEIDSAIDLVDDRQAADDQLDDARLCQLLTACVGELDEAVRTALLLRYQQGFSFEEMAEICREQAGTLQARVTRALPVLRKRIAARLRGPE